MKSLIMLIVSLVVALAVVSGVSQVAVMVHEQGLAAEAAAKEAKVVRKQVLNALTGKQRKVLRLTVAASVGSMVRDDESCAVLMVAQTVGYTDVKGTLRDIYAGCGYVSDDYLAFGVVAPMVRAEWREQLLAMHRR